METLAPQYVTDAMVLVLVLSMPPILVAVVVGLSVSFLLALTQLQEQTLSFAVKLIAVTLAILGTAFLTGDQLLMFAGRMFDAIPNIR